MTNVAPVQSQTPNGYERRVICKTIRCRIIVEESVYAYVQYKYTNTRTVHACMHGARVFSCLMYEYLYRVQYSYL